MSGEIEVDTLVIGAGLLGSSVAMHLSALGVERVRVIDFDLEGTLSSSELNAGGVRATWLEPTNILVSKASIEYYATVAQEVGYRPCGYLWMFRPETEAKFLKARVVQTRLGWEVQAWDVQALRTKIPFIDKTDDLSGAVFAPRDGLLNPNRLKNHYRDRAVQGGVIFDDRTLVRSAERVSGQSKIKVQCELILNKPLDLDQKRAVLTQQGHELQTRNITYRANRVVNASGAWAPSVAQMLGHHCPSQPHRRQVCIFDCRDVDLTPFGMMVDPSGVYFHPEATNGLAGFAIPQEKQGYSFEYDGESFFMDYVWPALFERSSRFERLKHITGWGGLYEESPDHSPIIGKVNDTHYEAHSFSGHGVMHSFAAGRGLAELMVRGRFETLDLSQLDGSRFLKGIQLDTGTVI